MSDSLWPHELQYTRLESFTISQSWLKLMSIVSLMPSNHLILCLLIILLPSIFFSIRAFSSELAKWHAKSLQSCLILQPHWLSVSRLFCPWDSPDKNMGVVSLALLQLMFPTQGLNPCFLCFLHWQAGSLPLVTPVVVVVRLLSCVPLFATPRTAAHQASLFFTISPSLLKLMSIESAIPPNHLILCLPLFFLPSIFPSIRVLRAGSSHHMAKLLELQHQSFSEYSGLVSFRIDLFGLFAVQGTLKSLLQHHSSKASIRWHSAFFMVQLSHSYMTTGKTITLTRWTFVGKVMSLLLNMLSSLVTVFFQEASVF